MRISLSCICFFIYMSLWVYIPPWVSNSVYMSLHMNFTPYVCCFKNFSGVYSSVSLYMHVPSVYVLSVCMSFSCICYLRVYVPPCVCFFYMYVPSISRFLCLVVSLFVYHLYLMSLRVYVLPSACSLCISFYMYIPLCVCPLYVFVFLFDYSFMLNRLNSRSR